MTSATYYECHVTMKGDPKLIEDTLPKLGWKFSRIDGDALFGEGVKCYATRHFNGRLSLEEVTKCLNDVAKVLHEVSREIGNPIDILRRKVEVVVYDQRGPYPEEIMK